jgi:hypothetical protein
VVKKKFERSFKNKWIDAIYNILLKLKIKNLGTIAKCTKKFLKLSANNRN